MKPPASRYRVEERDGRLIVIDQQADGTPDHASPDRRMAKPARVPPMIALVSWNRRDESGRPLLATHILFDRDGPRSVALSQDAVRHVDIVLWTLLGLITAFAVLFVVSRPFAVILAIGVALLMQGKPLRTFIGDWLDDLEAKTAQAQDAPAPLVRPTSSDQT